MTLPDLSALGLELETSALQREGAKLWCVPDGMPLRAEWYASLVRDFDRQSAEIARLIIALSEAERVSDAWTLEHERQATAREAAARETIATLTAENAELTRRAADAYRLARQPAPEPVDGGGNDADRSRHFPMKD